jgi:hypothetical protein
MLLPKNILEYDPSLVTEWREKDRLFPKDGFFPKDGGKGDFSTA